LPRVRCPGRAGSSTADHPHRGDAAMSSTLLEIFQRVAGRRADRRDLEVIDNLSANLPGAVLTDIGMMTEIAIRADHVRQLEGVLDRAGNIACRKAQIDGERYAIDAANKVWRKVLDQLPV